MNLKRTIKKEYFQYRELLSKFPPLALSVLILSVVCMNLLANKELFETEWIALDCGFTLSWIPFMIMDCVCKVYGGKASMRISALAISVNLVTFLIFKMLSMTPGYWGEYHTTGLETVNESLNNTIGGSTWIVVCSAVSMMIASVVNAVINISISKVTAAIGFKEFALRSFTSTAIAQFVDNLLFTLMVSVPLFGWSLRQVLLCSLTGALFELVLEILFSVFGYRLARSWQK